MGPEASWARGLRRKGTAGAPKSPGFKVPHENETTDPTHAGSVWRASRGGGGSANVGRERGELAEWSIQPKEWTRKAHAGRAAL